MLFLFLSYAPCSRHYIFNYIKECQFDAGQNWNANSIIKLYSPGRPRIEDKFKIKSGVCISQASDPYLIFDNGKLTNSIFFHARGSLESIHEINIQMRFTNYESNLVGFTGSKQNRKRAGFSAGEYDIATVTFGNYKRGIQLGRNYLNIGTNQAGNILGDYTSPSIDGGLIYYQYNNTSFISGYYHLDNKVINEKNYQRYLAIHGFEYRNHKLAFSYTEIAVHGGVNRPMDLSYLNPLAAYIEIELNDRGNVPMLPNSGNWLSNFSVDYFCMKSKVRLSCNVLIDDFQIDFMRRDSISDALAANYRIAKIFNLKDNLTVDIYQSTCVIGTRVYKHESGFANLVARDFPISYYRGSDLIDIKTGANLTNNKYFINMEYIYSVSGNNSIIHSNYVPSNLSKSTFPSEPANINHTFLLNFNYQFSKLSIYIWSKLSNGMKHSIGFSTLYYL